MLLAIDTETQGSDFSHGAKAFCVITCDEDRNQDIWITDVNPRTRQPEWSKSDLADIHQSILSADGYVFHNFKFDNKALKSIGINIDWPWDRTYDTVFAAHLLASNEPKNLTDLADKWLDTKIKGLEDGLETAVKKARSLVSTAKRSKTEVRSDLKDWRIAEKGLEEMPSAKEQCWRLDYWLPRAICTYAKAQRDEWVDEEHYCREKKSKAVPWWWEYANPDHPWLTVLDKYAILDPAITMGLWKVFEMEMERRG